MSNVRTLTSLAQLLSGPARLKMLVALQTEGELEAGELAAAASITPQAASAHIAKLRAGGLIVRSDSDYGPRRRVFSLADDDVARAIEALSVLAAAEPSRDSKGVEAAGRLCYDHLGGPLGHMLLKALLERRVLEAAPSVGYSRDYRVTTEGSSVLAELGLDLIGLEKQRRDFATRCLNVAEVDAHLAGSLGQALGQSFIERGWVVMGEGHHYALTPAGQAAFADHFAWHLLTNTLTTYKIR